MEWADKVGALPIEWNWLAGEPEFEGVGGDFDRLPALIHYTLGLPIVPGATKTEWDFKWYSERQRLVDRLLADPSLDNVKNDEPAASPG